ncbi:unnamed protein product, partial [Heterosigma akashiwo]
AAWRRGRGGGVLSSGLEADRHRRPEAEGRLALPGRGPGLVQAGRAQARPPGDGDQRVPPGPGDLGLPDRQAAEHPADALSALLQLHRRPDLPGAGAGRHRGVRHEGAAQHAHPGAHNHRPRCP